MVKKIINKLNPKTILFLLSLGLVAFIISITRVNAESSRQFIYLNELKNVSVSSGSYQCYTYTPQTNQYFVVETFGSYDTKIKVTNTSTGTIIDDDSGEGNNARIYFRAVQNQTVYIYTQIWGYGSASYQIQLRKQTFSMFGYDEGPGSNGINTIPDLTSPYNSFSSIFDCFKYENVSATYARSNDNRFLARINSEIMFFTGHGAEDGTGIMFYDEDYHVEYIFNTSTFDVSENKVTLLAACHSADSYNPDYLSIAERFVQCGAKSCVGFADDIETLSSRIFSDRFFSAISAGINVEVASGYASSGLILPWDTCYDYVIFGDEETIVTKITVSNSTFYTRSIDNIVIPFKEYTCININDICSKYYEIINGCLTNNTITIFHDGDRIINIEESLSIYDCVLPKNVFIANNEQSINEQLISKRNFDSYLIDRKDTIYCNLNNKMVPIMVTTITAKKNNHSSKEYVFLNLCTGEEVKYKDIIYNNK